MTFSVSYLIELKDKFSIKADKIAGKLDRISQKATKLGKSMSLKVTAPIGLVGGLALKSAAQLETMSTAFVGILGNAEAAKDMVMQLNDFTAKTPFQLEQVAGSARQLLAAGVAVENINDNLQFLGNIASSAKIPLSDMSAIFSKLKNKGRAQAEELNQMAERGIPILQTLSEQLGVSKQSIMDLGSQGKLTSDIVEKALRSMTEEGGFAFKAMINQSKTFTGLVSTLKDNLGLTAASIGDLFLPQAKEFASWLTDTAQGIRNWVKRNPELASGIIKIAGVLALLGPALITIGQIATGMKAIGVASKFALGPIGAVVTAIAALITYWDDVKGFFKDISDTVSSKFQSAMSGEKGSGLLGDVVSLFKGRPDEMAKSTQGVKGQGASMIGDITVKAEPGSKVTKAQFSGENVGINAEVM